MSEEFDALLCNGTWELVSLLPGKSFVGCCWVFTVKYLSDGTVELYKTRLIAMEYTQTYGVDYAEAFSLVAKIGSIRILISLVALVLNGLYFSWM